MDVRRTPRRVVYSRCAIKSVTSICAPDQSWAGTVDWTFCILVPPGLDAQLIEGSTHTINDLAERGVGTHALVTQLGITFPNRMSIDDGSLELWVRRGGGATDPPIPGLQQTKYVLSDFPRKEDISAVWVVRWAFSGVFGQPFELGYFPFDEQILRTEVAVTQFGVEFASAEEHAAWMSAYASRLGYADPSSHATDHLDATWRASPASAEWNTIARGGSPCPRGLRFAIEPPHLWTTEATLASRLRVGGSEAGSMLPIVPTARSAGLRLRRKPFDALLNAAAPLVLTTGFGILTALGSGGGLGGLGASFFSPGLGDSGARSGGGDARTGSSLEVTTTFFLASMGVRSATAASLPKMSGVTCLDAFVCVNLVLHSAAMYACFADAQGQGIGGAPPDMLDGVIWAAFVAFNLCSFFVAAYHVCGGVILQTAHMVPCSQCAAPVRLAGPRVCRLCSVEPPQGPLLLRRVSAEMNVNTRDDGGRSASVQPEALAEPVMPPAPAVAALMARGRRRAASGRQDALS